MSKKFLLKFKFSRKEIKNLNDLKGLESLISFLQKFDENKSIIDNDKDMSKKKRKELESLYDLGISLGPEKYIGLESKLDLIKSKIPLNKEEIIEEIMNSESVLSTDIKQRLSNLS